MHTTHTPVTEINRGDRIVRNDCQGNVAEILTVRLVRVDRCRVAITWAESRPDGSPRAGKSFPIGNVPRIPTVEVLS